VVESKEISAGQVKELREKTGAGMMDCKHALEETGGNIDKAVLSLRKKGLASVKKREEKTADQGVVESYLHIGKQIGSLIELNCETDYVARNSEFLELAHMIALQVAACNPMYLDRDSVPADVVESKKKSCRAESEGDGKPEKVMDQIVEGRLDKFYQEECLIEQPYVKDPSLSVGDLLAEASGKLGEKLAIRRYGRFQVGEKEEGA